MMRAFPIAALLVACFAPPARGDFRAGFSSRTVNPDPLLPVSGGMGPSHPAVERKGDLTVGALVIDDGGSPAAIVSADFLGFPGVLGDRVRSRVPGIPPERILIGATHTHSAPDLYGFPDGKGGTATDLKYVDAVVASAAGAIRDAAASLRSASLKVATGKARGKIAWNAYAPDLYDPRVSVIQVLEAGGRPIATLVNYAIHPEVLGSGRGICSPDLVGPLRDRIEEMGGGRGIFMNGAQGGMVTADNRLPGGGEANGWDECIRIGRLLADEALRIVAAAPVEASPSIRLDARTVTFPVDSPALREVLRSSPIGFGGAADSVSTRLCLLDIGSARILTIPGEALPNIGFYLKRKLGREHVFLFGLTNDAFGYILTPVDWGSFERYDYISRTCLGERTGEILIGEALGMVAAAGGR